MDLSQPESLTVTKTVPQGITRSIVYAADPHGNIWQTLMVEGVQGEWRLFKKAEEIVYPTLSWDQMLERASKQQ